MSQHSPEAHAPLWIPVLCTDDRLRGMYRQHYSSLKARGLKRRAMRHASEMRVVGPGKYSALLTSDSCSGFIWRAARYRQDGQAGIECTMFRRVGAQPPRSSCLILGAMWFARKKWPGERLFTFVDPTAIDSKNPGYCFIAAGWRRLPGRTARGLVVLEVDA